MATKCQTKWNVNRPLQTYIYCFFMKTDDMQHSGHIIAIKQNYAQRRSRGWLTRG